MKYRIEFKNGNYEYTFENGISLWGSRITIDNVGFPIRHAGDVFHLLRMGKINTAADIPSKFRNW